MIEMEPIGVIRSPVTEMSLGNWGSVESEIHLNEAYTDGLRGLEGFSHVMVVFYLDRARFSLEKHLLRHPRGRKHLPKVGVFAQRTKYRPNPIGVSSVELVRIKGNVLTVKSLDALDGTPVLDLKPYMPVFDKIDNAELPDWVEQFEEGYF